MAWQRTIFGEIGSTTLGPGTATVSNLNLIDATNQIVFDSDAAVNKGTMTMAALTAARTWTLPDATDQFVMRATTDTLTNKTLTAPVIATIVNTGTLTLPTSTDTLMGRATTDTLTNKTLSGAVVSGVAPATPTANKLYTDSIVKGWVETSGAGTPAIDDDLNVSSITDNGTGDFTINWATAFANANYAVLGMHIGTAQFDRTVSEDTATAKSTTVVRIALWDASGAARIDPEVGFSLIAIGDQ